MNRPSHDVVPRLFGTNGVRGVVNSEDMDCMFAMRLGLAIGTFMKGSVIIGTDARTSNEMLKAACASGIMATGCDVLDCGIVPTPTLQYAVKSNRVAGGVVMTASHNPPEFNGVKCIDADGTEMSRDGEEAIERIFHHGNFLRADWTGIGRPRKYATAIEEYLDGIVSRINLASVRRAELRVAVDCSNGASSLVTPILLDKLGVRYVTINADLSGAFPGHNSEPTPENAHDLAELVGSGGFDLGFIHDGDGDRTIFVDEKGRYLHGDRSLAIVSHYVCLEKPGSLVVTNVASSMAVEDAVRMAGGRVIYTRVGSPTIARIMKEKGGVFGGEENGGLIFPEFQYCRDGAMAAAKVLEIISKYGSLSSLDSKIPAYSQYKTKTRCPEGKKEPAMQRLLSEIAGERIDITDGAKIFLKDGWVLVRPSGTEAIFRIFAEARTPDRAKQLAEEYREKIEKAIKK